MKETTQSENEILEWLCIHTVNIDETITPLDTHTIAAGLGLSYSTVQPRLKKLATDNHIKCIKQPRQNGSGRRKYFWHSLVEE